MTVCDWLAPALLDERLDRQSLPRKVRWRVRRSSRWWMRSRRGGGGAWSSEEGLLVRASWQVVSMALQSE
eukprot:9088482-Pyramimonas_sp.AAC.1